MSIIPGIETTAPERTDTSSGRSASPSARLTRPSKASSASSISSASPSGQAPPAREAAMHASVVTVKPSGTGMPSESISASPAPLPPSRPFMSAEPSENA